MKGMITAVLNDQAVFLSENGEFLTIKNKQYEVGTQIEYRKPTYTSYYAMAASFILMLFFSISGYHVYYTPVSYLSIDINPSLQLDINRFDRVIGVHALNEDATLLLTNIRLKHESVEVSIDKIIMQSKETGYLNPQNNQVIIDIVTPSDKLVSRVDQNATKFDDDETEVQVSEDSQNELTLSKDLGVSIGRAKAISDYTDTFGGNEEDNAKNLAKFSVGELKKQVKQSKEKKSSPKTEQIEESTKQEKQETGKPKKTEKKTENKEQKEVKQDNKKASDNENKNADRNAPKTEEQEDRTQQTAKVEQEKPKIEKQEDSSSQTDKSEQEKSKIDKQENKNEHGERPNQDNNDKNNNGKDKKQKNNS